MHSRLLVMLLIAQSTIFYTSYENQESRFDLALEQDSKNGAGITLAGSSFFPLSSKALYLSGKQRPVEQA